MLRGSRASFSEQICDEIALEGLEGTTLETLWLNLAKSLKCKSELSANFKTHVWEFIKYNGQNFQFYELPTERETLPVFNRFGNLDEEFGIPISITKSILPRYKLITTQDNQVMGSCEHYLERVLIPLEEIINTTLNEASERWGNKLVIVASQDLRYEALIPKNAVIPNEITSQQYAILEVIARSRTNGETTAGSASLQDFFKDAHLIFYLKKRLLKAGLIVAQPFTELHNGRFVNNILLTLPRFYSAHKNAITSIIEKIFQTIKETPNNTMPLVEIRNMFSLGNKKKVFQKITSTQEFRQVFDIKSVPFSVKKERPKLITEGNESSENETPSKRTKIMVSLRDPLMKMSEIFATNDDKSDGEDVPQIVEENKIERGRLAYVDMALKDQFYNAIYLHGMEGASQLQLSIELDTHPLATRQIVQKLVQLKLVTVYIKSVGRQRTQMYVADAFAATVLDYNEKKQERQNLKCNDEPNIPEDSAEYLDYQENSDFTASIKEFRYIIKESHMVTFQQASRMAIIVEALNENCLLHVPEVTKKIIIREKETGETSLVCRKSVTRILNLLCKQGTIQMYQAVIKCVSRGDVRFHKFITHPKIHIDHPVIKRELAKLKNDLFVRVEDLRFRDNSKLQAAQQKERKSAGGKNEKGINLFIDKTDREAIQRMPKFLVSRYMHEFLFYIVVELNEFQPPVEINEELLEHWKETEPSLQAKEYLELIRNEDSGIKAYTREISWRTFIPPLKTYGDKPAGWVFLLDAMDRMPLSLFMKIFRLESKLHESLDVLLKHPIRQHYVVSQLPVELSSLINRVYMQKVFLTILKLLNNMGLVQVSDPNANKTDKLMMWAYFNRKAQIIDTTTSGIGYSTISRDNHYETIRYEFNTFDDVHNYWMSLQRICVYTKLGFRKNVEREEKQRVKELSFLKHSLFDEAPHNDVGYIPGEQMGAAGLSMQLFAHRFRNWSWALHANTKPTNLPLRPVGRSVASHKAKILKIRRAARKKSNLPVAILSRSAPTAAVAGTKRSARPPRDAFDREALRNKPNRRVNWSPEEDRIIKIGRAVYIYLSSPFLYLQLTAMAKICRDVIRQVLGIRTKTIESCRRRDQFLYRNNRHLPEAPLWVDILRGTEEIDNKYGRDFLNNLKFAYPNRDDFCEALEIHFVQIMCFVYKLINRLGTTIGPRFCIPDTIADFQRLYRTRALNKSDYVQHENPRTQTELNVTVAYSLLHSMMCCARDKTLYLPQAFELFKSFSENILSMAFAKARKDGLAVNHKRRQMRMSLAPSQLAGPSYALSSKYRFTLMFLKIPYHIFDAVHETLVKALTIFYGPSTSSSANHIRSYELKSMHIGHLLLVGEGTAHKYWSIDLKLPTNILIEDTEESSDKLLTSSQGSVENASVTEESRPADGEVAAEKRIRIKIQRSITSSKVYYSPYDIISKLPNRKLHFFCALDHLQKNVEINLNRLSRQEDDFYIIECPFKCIMKCANYLDAIERIVHEKKQILTQLVDGPSHKLNNPATFVNSVKVQPSNLLGIVRMLETVWREKDETTDRKDFGRKSVAFINRTPVDWQKLCQDILDFKDNQDDDFDKIDEYEAALNKDDRLRDTYVVNFPLLKIKPTHYLNSHERMENRGMSLPLILCDVEKQRKEIMRKIDSDAYWTYTEENVASLLENLTQPIFSPMERKHIVEIHDFIMAREFGVTVQELLLEFCYENFLWRALQFLTEKFFIKRVGVSVHVYVHRKYLRDWLVQTFHITRRDHENLKATESMQKRKNEDKTENVPKKRIKLDGNSHENLQENSQDVPEQQAQGLEEMEFRSVPKEKKVIVLRPRPWMRLNGSLNRRVLDRWLGSILSECIARSGLTVQDLCQHFQYMFPADVHFLLETLSELKCVSLKSMKEEKANLFSEYTPMKENVIKEICDPTLTYVTAQADAVMRLTNFIGEKKYNVDFV